MSSRASAYVRENYDRIMLNVKKGDKTKLQKIAKEKGLSLNEYIKQAIAQQYKLDTNTDI